MTYDQNKQLHGLRYCATLTLGLPPAVRVALEEAEEDDENQDEEERQPDAPEPRRRLQVVATGSWNKHRVKSNTSKELSSVVGV